MTPGAQRRMQRRAHIVAAVVLSAYVYLPLVDEPLGTGLEGLVRFVALPVLAVTGILMWQAPRIRRALKSARASSGARPRASRSSLEGSR